jgi:hypothetical protein
MDAVQQPRGSARPESRWRGFFFMLDSLEMEFPDLGNEGRWQQMKELYPATFLNFILSFDDQAGYSDLNEPAPKTEKEIYHENRARITQAAKTEALHLGKNGKGPEQVAKDIVNEALKAL